MRSSGIGYSLDSFSMVGGKRYVTAVVSAATSENVTVTVYGDDSYPLVEGSSSKCKFADGNEVEITGKSAMVSTETVAIIDFTTKLIHEFY